VTTCPARERLAAEDAVALEHASSCEACRAEIAAMTAVVAVMRRGVPAVSLAAERRAAMRAVVLAASDAPIAARRGTRAWMIAVVAIAAALIAIAIWPSGVAPTALPPPTAPGEPLAVSTASSATSTEAPAPAPVRAARREVTSLADGATTFDARNGAPVRVAIGDTRVEVTDAKVEVVAKGGVVATVRVFAGSVEIAKGDRRVIVSSGELWSAPDASDETGASFRAFQDGWTALRAGDDRDAIAAFDRATDPAIAEDAAYWAAIAAERAGDREEAARRLRAFVARFPGSARVDDAKAALDRLGALSP
jgi:hypothetical protein